MSARKPVKDLRYRVTRLRNVDSTSTYAKTLASEGAREGHVIVADYQSKGRGQFRRKWVSSPGENLLFSLVLRPRHGVHKTPLITMLAARTLKDTLESYAGLSCKIKKPNDVLINGKKVGGILTETHSKSGHVPFVILGIGINVNSTEKTLIRGATSLREERGLRLSRDMLLARFLKNFKVRYNEFNRRG